MGHPPFRHNAACADAARGIWKAGAPPKPESVPGAAQQLARKPSIIMTTGVMGTAGNASLKAHASDFKPPKAFARMGGRSAAPSLNDGLSGQQCQRYGLAACSGGTTHALGGTF